MNQSYGYPQNNNFGNNQYNAQRPNGWNQYNNQGYGQTTPYVQNNTGYNYPPQNYPQQSVNPNYNNGWNNPNPSYMNSTKSFT